MRFGAVIAVAFVLGFVPANAAEKNSCQAPSAGRNFTKVNLGDPNLAIKKFLAGKDMVNFCPVPNKADEAKKDVPTS